MVMTEWMREVKKALETIPKDTPNRLKAAMAKAKLTYKKGPSSSHHRASAAASHSMKKSHKRGRGRGRSSKSRKGMRKGSRSRKHYKGGAMSKLNPADYDGKGVGTSGVGVQIEATTKST
jgi:hypothetical protein